MLKQVASYYTEEQIKWMQKEKEKTGESVAVILRNLVNEKIKGDS